MLKLFTLIFMAYEVVRIFYPYFFMSSMDPEWKKSVQDHRIAQDLDEATVHSLIGNLLWSLAFGLVYNIYGVIMVFYRKTTILGIGLLGIGLISTYIIKEIPAIKSEILRLDAVASVIFLFAIFMQL